MVGILEKQFDTEFTEPGRRGHRDWEGMEATASQPLGEQFLPI
jgi:hypothetical protein